VADQTRAYAGLTAAQAVKKIKSLESQMHQHARNLEFEEAGKLRDEIKRLQRHALGEPDRDTG